MPAARSRLRSALRVVLGVAMIGIGATHFANPEPFVRIVPAWLPAPLVLVWVSGVFEMLGGAGVLVRRTRRAAGLGLVALYVAVFPANVNQALHAISFDGMTPIPPAVLWLRLPLQAVLIALVLWVSRPDVVTMGAPLGAAPSSAPKPPGAAKG
jgi:uncharacterized membrane protein